MSKLAKKFLEKLLHSDLDGIQGGKEGEHYHLTKAEWERTPSRPFIVSPENGAEGVNQVPLIKGTGYYHPYNLPMFRRDIQIATDVEFENIVYEIDNEEDKFSASTEFQIFPKPDGSYYFEPGTTYYVRIRYQDVNEHWSEWSDVSAFTTMAEFPENALLAPIMAIPVNGGIVRAKDPILAMSTAKMLVGASSLDKANWQIAANPNFDPVLYQAMDSDDVTLHQATGLNLTTALGTEFYARGQQRTVEGDWSPWATVHFGIRPDYEDLVFGVRKIFSKRYGVPFVFNIDPTGEIVSIPKKYWDNHPLYQFTTEEVFVKEGQTAGNLIYSTMAIVPKCYMKYSVYDNDDGDMVIDTWYSPTPQTEDGWRVDMAFENNSDGFYHDACLPKESALMHINGQSNIAVPVSAYDTAAKSFNPRNVLPYMKAIDDSWHLWTIYERRLLLDLMIAEYATLDASRVSAGSGAANNASSFIWRSFRGLQIGGLMHPLFFDGIRQTDVSSEAISKIQVLTPDGGNWMPYDVELAIGNNMHATNILRGYSEEMGFDVALLGIVSKTEPNDGKTTSHLGMSANLRIAAQNESLFGNYYGSFVQDGIFALSSYYSNNNSTYVRMSKTIA